MATNFYLVRQVCECGKEDRFHLGQSAYGNEFLFHAQETWNTSMRYTLWTDRIISGLELNGRIEDEYGQTITYLQLLERIKEDSQSKVRIETDHDSSGRAWMIGEFH